MRLAKRSLAFNRVYNKTYLCKYIKLLVQLLIKKGNKLFAEKIIFNFLNFLKNRYYCVSLEGFLKKIFSRFCPKISFVRRKIAAIIYLLPWYITSKRSKHLLIHWFYRSCCERFEFSFSFKIMNEFVDLYKGYGRTVKKLEDFYGLALKNKPFVRLIYKQRGAYKSRLKKYGIKRR